MSERFADLHFAQPELLALGGVACAALIALALLASWRRRRALARFASREVVRSLTESVSRGRRLAKLALLVLGVAAGFTALAQPRWGYHLEERERRGVDLLFAIDTSRSMLAADLRPDRLTRAKLAVRDLVRELPGDRAGLVAFAGEAFLQCPMTLDRDVFERSLDELDTRIIPEGGTNLAAAIRESVAAFGETEHEKLVVLLTDGEALEGDALIESERAAERGVRVYTVGVGSAAGSPITVRTERGEPALLRGPDGEIVRSALDEATLRSIADLTGGAYRALGPSGRGLAELYAAHFAALPRHAIAARQERVHHEQFQWPLGLALLLLLAEPLLGERRRVRARRAVLASAATALVLLLAPRALASPRDGQAAYARGDYAEAARLWAEAAERERSAELRFNAGAAAYRAGDYDGAAQAFARTIEEATPELQQRAYYDLGNAHYRRGEGSLEASREDTIDAWRSAARAYEAALALDRADRDARHNLALVRRRLAELERGEEPRQEDQSRASQGTSGASRGSSGASQGSSGGSQSSSDGSRGASGASQDSSGGSQGASGASQGSSGGSRGTSGASQGSSGGSQGTSGASQDSSSGSQGTSGASEDSSGASQSSSGASQGSSGAPRTPPGDPRTPPDAPRTRPDAPQASPDAPQASPDAPRTPQGASLAQSASQAASAAASRAGASAQPRSAGEGDASSVVAGSTGFGGPPGRLSRAQALDVLRTVRAEQRRFPLTQRRGEGAARDAARRDW